MAVRQRRKAIRVKVEMMLMRPAKMFDLKMVELTKRLLRFLLSVTRMEKIRNGYVRGAFRLSTLGTKLERRGEKIRTCRGGVEHILDTVDKGC